MKIVQDQVIKIKITSTRQIIIFTKTKDISINQANIKITDKARESNHNLKNN